MKIAPVLGAAALAGLLTTTATAGETSGGFLISTKGNTFTIIAGDGDPDPFQVFPLRVRGANFTFAITDADETVLAYTSDNTLDLEGAGAGSCLVFGVAYDGEFDFPTGGSVRDLTATESLSLSRNYITVNRESDGRVDGGWVLDDVRGRGRVVLNLDRSPDPFRVYSWNEASSSTLYAYIITDDEGTVLGFPPANSIDLSGAPPGVCRVYGISYTGTLDTTTGGSVKDVTSDTGIADLSRNFITAIRRGSGSSE